MKLYVHSENKLQAVKMVREFLNIPLKDAHAIIAGDIQPEFVIKQISNMLNTLETPIEHKVLEDWE